MKAKFVKKTSYYTGIVYEFNLPTGWSCPFAKECLVKVDKQSGKFDNKSNAYKCYAANSERFPGVRNHRWDNFDFVKTGGVPELPKNCKSLRLHMSGDFFNQDYFDMWLRVAGENPDVEMWAYTKSLNYWVNRINEIPKNLILTASYGGKLDHLIKEHNLKNVIVYPDKESVPADRPIDTNDDWARKPNVNFALVDNFNTGKAKQNQNLFSQKSGSVQ